MIKKLIKFATSMTILVTLTSCGEPEPFMVTFKSAVNEVHQIDYSTLSKKINNEDFKESFVLLTYDNASCSCWTLFQSYLEKTYIKETGALFYDIKTSTFGQDTFGININSVQPALCFFNKGKLVKQFDYSNNKSIFLAQEGNDKDFRNVMNKYVVQQDKLFLFNTYKAAKEQMPLKERGIFYAYKTSCPDCRKASLDVLYPYLNNKENIINKVYMLDIDKYDNQDYDYQGIKDALLLSNKLNEDYGYLTGFVPTFQYWENGQIKDASVFLNDSLQYQDNVYTVKDSFYSTIRKNKLSYLDNVEVKILEGLQIDPSNVIPNTKEGVTTYYWKTEDALKYHKPLLNAFLTKYVN